MKVRVASAAREWLHRQRLPAIAKAELARDRAGLPEHDPGNEKVLPALMAWLAMAQDRSRTQDGGVARDFSLIHGWASSYPETTGYIIPTMLDYARLTGERVWRDRALRMADWLVSIQMPCGGFQGGKIDSKPVVPVTFNTGQILLGLAAAEKETGRYRMAMRRAADWLVQTQDPDGCWRSHESPFAASGDKQYETHVAWGLFEAERIDPGRGYREAGLKNVTWAIKDLPANGWFEHCALAKPACPITHTIGYALRGVIEACHPAPDKAMLEAASRTANGLRSAMRSDGFLPGAVDRQWHAASSWSCLTGSAQVALCWMHLAPMVHDRSLVDAAKSLNRYLRRTIRLAGEADLVGAVRGSFPVSGGYCSFAYPNWAAKFLADSIMLEIQGTQRPVGALHHAVDGSQSFNTCTSRNGSS